MQYTIPKALQMLICLLNAFSRYQLHVAADAVLSFFPSMDESTQNHRLELLLIPAQH